MTTNAAAVPVAGEKVTLGDRDFIVPPLNAKGLRKHEADVEAIDKAITPAQKLGIVCAISLTALQRNYPELTIDFLEERVDMRNMLPLFNSVMGVSASPAPSVGADAPVVLTTEQ